MYESIEIMGATYFALATQLVFFGWRINREIFVREKGKYIWFPVCDRLNVAFRTIVNGFIKGLRFFLVPLEHNLTRSSTV